MTASVLFLPRSKRRPKQRDYIRPVSSEGEDVSRALAGRRQVEFKYAPTLLDIGRRPKLAADNGERPKLGDETALSVAPFFQKLRHAPASSLDLPLQSQGTFIFPSRNVNYRLAVCFALLTASRYSAFHERQAVQP